jgi:hypothetical protein
MSPPGRWQAQAAVTTGAGTIWAIGGAACPASGPKQCTINYNGYSFFGLCCTGAGAPADLTPLLTNKTKADATGVQMGTDAHGRVWLAWMDGATTKPGVSLKLVQVDPTTLAPLSHKTVDHLLLNDTSGSATTHFALACADSCRVVYQSVTGAASWDGSATTRLWTTNVRTNRGGNLLAAAIVGGKLAVGSWSNKAGSPDGGQRLTAARGDAAGRNLRTTGTIDIPQNLPDGPTHYFYPTYLPAAVATPKGLVAVALYNDGGKSRLLATVLPD